MMLKASAISMNNYSDLPDRCTTVCHCTGLRELALRESQRRCIQWYSAVGHFLEHDSMHLVTLIA